MVEKTDLSLKIKVSELERNLGPFNLNASQNDLVALGERFGLVALSSLSAEVRIVNKGSDNGILVSGQLKAELVQRCIATLKSVPENLDIPFELLLVDPEKADRMDANESYLDPDAPEYDALESDVIDIGEIVAQTLSISMDPYPRLDVASTETPNNPNVTLNEPPIEKPSPFSALGALKDKS